MFKKLLEKLDEKLKKMGSEKKCACKSGCSKEHSHGDK